MSILSNSLMTGADTASGYQITRSLRFNSADSAYLSRTPGSAGNRKTWTWAGWIKRSGLGSNYIFTTGTSSSTAYVYFDNDNRLVYWDWRNGGNGVVLQTNALFRDTSAWLHVVCSVDYSAATAADRAKLYVNGVAQTYYSSTYPLTSEDSYVNATVTHYISAGSNYVNGYLADIHFIDGQALDPTSFGAFDSNGVWQPIEYTGSYGTNGFHLDFSDNSSTAALGYDAAGSNDWTPNNFSVTAGSGNDSLVDSPTNYGTDTGAGGEVRGNYCTFNPLASNGTFTNGNLVLDLPSSTESSGLGSVLLPASGKWYWEIAVTTIGTDSYIGIGTGTSRTSLSSSYYSFHLGGEFRNTPAPGFVPSNAAPYTTSDIIGVAYDAGAATLSFYKNGALQGTYAGIPVNQYVPFNYTYAGSGLTAQRVANFGQRPFAYTAPSGYKALCSTNLPTPTILNGAAAMDVVTYTGTGATLTPTSSLGFSPDLVWIKSRSAVTDNTLYDIVRGAQARLESNNTDAEVTTDGGLTAFNSNGFTVGTLAQVNTNTVTYAAWCWDAGSSTGTNNDGTISSQVRANASAGFSVVTYTGTGANATVGHGLGVAPSLVIVKNRSISDDWYVQHSGAGVGRLKLNTTDGHSSSTGAFQDTAATSTVFSVGTSAGTNGSGNSLVAYCFAPVSGYSAFGSYTGNGADDGPFVYTGFRPRWILIKSTPSGCSWLTYDTAINTGNESSLTLLPSSDTSELNAGDTGIDILSNGFKLKADASGYANYSTYGYIYAAFAENPFSISRAR